MAMLVITMQMVIKFQSSYTSSGAFWISELSLRLKKMKEAGHQCGVNEYNYLLKAEFLWN